MKLKKRMIIKIVVLALLALVPLAPALYLGVVYSQNQIQKLNNTEMELKGIETVRELLSIFREAKVIIHSKDTAPYGNSLSVNLTVPEKRFEAFKKNLLLDNQFTDNVTQNPDAQDIYKYNFKDFLENQPKTQTMLEKIVILIADQSQLTLDSRLDSYYLIEAMVIKYTRWFGQLMQMGNGLIDYSARQRMLETLTDYESSVRKAKTFLADQSLTKSDFEVLRLNSELLKNQINNLKVPKDQKDLFEQSKNLEEGFVWLNQILQKRAYKIRANQRFVYSLVFVMYALIIGIAYALFFKYRRKFENFMEWHTAGSESSTKASVHAISEKHQLHRDA